MAGIFANIGSDITQLDKLKKKIEEVEKALKSIDVNTDIGKGMEAQLKGLLSQYDTLVNKIAEAEAKVKLSVANINKAMKTISRQTPKTTETEPSSKPDTGNEDEERRAKIVEQAYKDLNSVIRENATEFDKQVKKWNEASNAIRIYGEEIKKIKAEQKSRGTDFTEVEARRMGTLNAAIEANRQKRNEASREMRNQIKIYQAADGSLNQLRAQLEMLKRAYADMTDIGSDEAKQLLNTLQQTSARVSEIEQSMGVYGRNVGNYASAFNGLGMSVQQIVRELPAATMGLNMFFLAISNNLPILTDEIKRARDANEELKKSGQSTVPVWKQLVGSILSWQTAMVVGITVLSMYGKEIMEWVGKLFKGEKQVDALAERMKTLNDIQREAGLSAAKERSELDVLYKATQDHTRSLKDRNAAADELQKRYPKYFENLSNEAILAGDAAQAYRQLTDDILKAAQARAAQDKITKNYERIFQLQRAINADTNWTRRNAKRADYGKATETQATSMMSTAGGFTQSYVGLTKYAAEYNRRIEALKKNQAELARLTKDNEYYAGLIDMEALTSGSDKKDKPVGQLKDYLDEILQLRADNEDRQVDLMADGTEKELAEIDLRYKRIRDKVKELEANLTKEQGGKLTPEQLALFGEAYNQIDRQQARDRAGVGVDDDTEKRLEAEQEAMNRYLKDYGTFQERKKAIADEYNQKIADASTDGDKLILQKQMEEALSDIDMEKLKESINWELVFSDLGNASKKSLQQVKKQLDDFKSSDEYKNMAIDQKKVIDEALNNIQSAIIDKGGLLGDLPEQLEELRKAQEELTAAQDEYNEAIKSGTDEQKESAQRKLNKAEQNVANAQNNTDKAAKRTTDNLLTLADALTQLGSNTEMTLSEIGQLAGGIANAFSEAGSKIGGIIGAIFSILDQVGQEGLFGFLGNVFESVGNALTGVFDSLLGWTGIDFGGESDPTLEQDIERLTLANQELEKAINNLTEKMDDAAVADASSIYEVQKENIEEQMKNTQEMMRRSASSSSDGFMGIGGHHATNTKINRGMTDADWKAISEAVGRTIDDAGDFFNLTSEEMWRVANEATSEYAKLKGLADDGYKDAAQFMDEYIEYWKELEELEEAYNEKLTSVSFDTVKDDFRNALINMEDSTEAFADNFEKMMQQAILESMMTGTYDKALQEWYQDFADSMKDGTLDTDEQEMLRKQWQDIVDSASEEWQSWRDLMGLEADGTKEQQQQASAGYSVAASQDSVDVLNGRLNAVYEAELRIEKNGELMYNVADEMRGIIAQSYLELQQISENTGEIIKPIKQMQLDIAEVKKNTAKL
ncbi:MAG TPA: hypothetical protein H9824_05840 [Candidatus Bacteroides pullicola]|uniref:Uncharacterized protein n=1 Tax=Candidatus Bacteroides pullicola TaxID=2838475 RepID=A0A9D2CKP5_9BACE|nr:hypothetical protein [Candidatus Bacteroides pullicola]